MIVSDNTDWQMYVHSLMSCSCDVPAWGIMLTVLFVLCLAVFLLTAIYNYKKMMTKYITIRTEADTDSLTGLWTRHAINRAILERQYLHSVDAPGWSVIFIDINGLKLINDEHGHLVGDCVLKIFAQSLSLAIRFNDHAGRWGGDEFIVLVAGMRTSTDMANFCQKLQQETSQLIMIDDKQVKINASFGYALVSVDGENVKDLIKVADARMYRNKQCAAAVQKEVVIKKGDS